MFLSDRYALEGFLIFASISIIYAFSLALYRVTLHPLARFPGPKLAAATGWYEFYFDIVKGKGYGGQFIYEIERMHKVYGPIVRINPEELHVKDSDFYDVLHSGNATRRDRWPPTAPMFGTPLAVFATIDHQLHRDRREADMPLFTTRAITDAELMIREQLQIMCNRVHEFFIQNKPVELRTLCSALTTDVIFKHVLGEELGLLKDLNRARNWRKMVDATSELVPIVKQFSWAVPYLAKLPLSFTGLINKHMAEHSRLQQTMYDRARKFKSELDTKDALDLQGAPPRTLFQAIQQSALPPHDKSINRLGQEAKDMGNAGGEPTGRVLELTIFRILSNPEVYRRLMTEIMEVMPDTDSVVPVKRLKELPWLRAVIKESLRCNAVIATRSPLVSPVKELQFKEWTIPRGTPVSLNTRDILHDPSIFEEPQQFKPERWLEGGEKGKKLDHYFFPFSKGARMCLGYQLAYSEFYLALSTLFRRFEFELYDTTYERDVKVMRDCFIGEAVPESVGVRVAVVKELD